ncbi:MAG: N-acetyl-gamma-glutamyl-phosphate reductase [Candidatus Accumulibacter sp.]|jgi:N-acetyl-gamma-glutamyl-phosphate reductase|nr:N-acetyl-gamma-glutamyl-phosphate reductase [Accumulibacter sp.]
MAHKIFVDGQEGTTGLQINEYLARRPDVEVLRVDPEKRKDTAERGRLINASDVTFLCLPDAAAREAVTLVDNPHTCVIDASTAHRVDPAWTFGLPELASDQRARIRASRRIANPGCHATGFILALRPLVDDGLVPAATRIAASSISGYSGGGKKLIANYATQRIDAPRPYALGQVHKHLPEMRHYAGLDAAPVFQPIVGPFYKGLAVTVYLHPSQFSRKATPEEVRRILVDRYAGEPFIRVAPLALEANTDAGGYFDVEANNDTNRVDLFVFGHAEGMLLVARLDNLGKGASGAAVQSMNVHLGIEESLGLE